MSAALQHSKAITHPPAWNHPVKLWKPGQQDPTESSTEHFSFFFSHLRSFHFDASVWRRPSRTPLTFPIRLAQYGLALLISWNAKATVAASVFSCLPASPHRPAHLPLPTPQPCSKAPLFFHSPDGIQARGSAQLAERQLSGCQLSCCSGSSHPCTKEKRVHLFNLLSSNVWWPLEPYFRA